MPLFDLIAVAGEAEAIIATLEADNADEAVVLTVLRMERRDTEIRLNGKAIARIYQDGRLLRLDRS